jgi:hypothetical protein
MIEVSEVRKRLLQTLEQGKRAGVQRRARLDAATRAYETFLTEVATPVFRMVAASLKAEGHAFTVFTPAGGLRLSSDRSAEDFIELFLDIDADPPQAAARVSRGRGHRLVNAERPIREGAAEVEQLTDEDVVGFLLAEIPAFVER